jgi:hypothetical protein
MVIALLPYLQAVPNLLGTRSRLQAKKGVGKVTAMIVHLQGKEVAFRFRLLPD